MAMFSRIKHEKHDLSFFNLKNVTTAYKKAKIDAWRLHSIDVDSFMSFELNFKENIVNFLLTILQPDYDIILTEKWLGGWFYRIKKIVPDTKVPVGEIFSAPEKNLRSTRVKNIDFRVFAKPTVNFHLLGALWIEMVGQKYGACLKPCVYGNRLRPNPNPRHAGSFQPYVRLLQNWKHTAIRKVKELLSKKQDVVVVTADVMAYYHSLKPDFLLNHNYLARHNIKLTKEEIELTQLLIDALKFWAAQTPLKTGLPVGLPVSAFIANLALVDFDKAIQDNLQPASYGRYVDDILIVLEKRKNFVNRKSVWEAIKNSSECFSLMFEGVESDKPILDFVPEYADDITSYRIAFNGDKCRVFFLDSESGVGFIRRLENQIREASSEFRLLPEHIGNINSISHRLQRLITADGDLADGFRKIDLMTFRKVDFTGFMKEMEFFHKTLHPSIWEKQRKVFYQFFRETILTLKHYAEYEFNLFRVIALCMFCGDFTELLLILKRLTQLVEDVKRVKLLQAAHPLQTGEQLNEQEIFRIPCSSLVGQWCRPLYKNIIDVIQRSFNGYGDAKYRRAYDAFRDAVKQIINMAPLPSDKASTYNLHAFVHDLSEFRYVENLYRNDIKSYCSLIDNYGARIHSLGIPLDEEFRSLFDDKFLTGIDLFQNHVLAAYYATEEIPYGLLFPTRPILPKDLFWLHEHDFLIKHSDEITSAFRGFDSKLYQIEQDGDLEIIHVYNDRVKQPKIALVNMVTNVESVATELQGVRASGNDLKRLCDIIELVNNVLRKEKDLDYLVFHELAIPGEWFVPIAERCAESGVSIISGIDYIVSDAKEKYCINPIWMSLVNERNNFRQQMYICEAKKEFSVEENIWISELGYKNDPNLTINDHAIVKHGGFCFSTLICSELTDIENRMRLRGLIDALFVLAWNKDVNSFSSIIEATTLDLHSYIIQCNNNVFGDSRIRVPAKQPYNRDLVRLRGGDSAYYVCARLSIDKLRDFQEDFYGAPSKAR